MRPVRKVIDLLLRSLLTLIGTVLIAWGALALSYRLPLPLWACNAVIFVWCLCGIGFAVLTWSTRPWRAVLGYAVLLATIGVWWGTLTPSNERIWADDVAQIQQTVSALLQLGLPAQQRSRRADFYLARLAELDAEPQIDPATVRDLYQGERS